MKKSRVLKKIRISSGDRLVDWFFTTVIQILNRKVFTIRIKNRLRIKGYKCELRGFMPSTDNENENDIYLAKYKRRDWMASALVHEALHILLEKTVEKEIERLEGILCWDRFSPEQKRIIKSYLPRKTSKVPVE